MSLGHTAGTVASMSRHPVVAVPRGWTAPANDRRPIAVAIDGLHSSTSTLGFAFTEASLRQAPVLVVHSAPLSELIVGEQITRLNLAEILAGWKARLFSISPLRPSCWPARLAKQWPRCRLMHSSWLLVFPTVAGSSRAGSVLLRARYSIAPFVRAPLFRSSTRAQRRPTRAHRPVTDHPPAGHLRAAQP
jgi:hypothetical protein